MKKLKICLDCGKEKSPSGNYCKVCGYKHRTRPSGLSYKIVVKNRGWIKKGQQLSLGRKLSEETKKLISEQMKGRRISPNTEFKKGQNIGDLNYNWKGENVGYHALHLWLTREYGKPKQCEFCENIDNIQWASRNYKYTRDREDWIHLCFKCHRKYDSQNGWGVASKMYNL